MEGYIPCEVAEGFFPQERSVVVTDYSGRRLTFFVDKDAVKVKSEPNGEKVVNGYVVVSLLKTLRDRALVNVPAEGEDSLITILYKSIKRYL